MNTITPNTKVIFSGKTHTTSGKDGASKSVDGFLDVKLAQPHPAAENLFAAAWSACYLGAIELAAASRKIKLPAMPSVDTQIDLNHAGGTTFFLKANLDVHIDGLDPAVVRELAETAHTICPYSKAVHGNIEVTTNVI